MTRIVEVAKRIGSKASMIVRCYEWIAWGVVVLACAMLPWSGVEPPLMAEQGRGFIIVDLALCAIVVIAAVAQGARVADMRADEITIVRTAAWLLLCAMALLAARFVWIMTEQGDIRINWTMAVIVALLSVSVICSAIGRVVYKAR